MHKYLPTHFEYMGNIFPQKYTKNRFFKLMKHPHNSHEKCQWNYIKAKRVVLERILKYQSSNGKTDFFFFLHDIVKT